MPATNSSEMSKLLTWSRALAKLSVLLTPRLEAPQYYLSSSFPLSPVGLREALGVV
jgi:hypothetical protein